MENGPKLVQSSLTFIEILSDIRIPFRLKAFLKAFPFNFQYQFATPIAHSRLAWLRRHSSV